MSATDAEKIVALRRELNDHCHRYYVANCPIISDAEYDARFRELQALEADHPEMADANSPTRRVGSPIPTGLRKVQHKVKMLSLDNVNNLDETAAFFAGHEDDEVTLEMKIDGLSLHLSYENGKLRQAITRGNGMEGADVTDNARTILTIPMELRKPVSIEIRGEVYWRRSRFEAFNATASEGDKFANPRNGASGSLQLKDSKEVARRKLDFVAYSIPTDLPKQIGNQEAVLEYLEHLGFISTMTLPVTKDMYGLPYLTCQATREELAQAIAFLDDYRKSLDLETDGLVIKLSSLALQRDVGEGTRSPKWAAAYKFPPETKETRLAGVVVQVGKTGQVTPVAQLEPVSLGGTVVARASLCNQDELDRLGIDIGDYVIVQRSGEVIPKVIGLARPSPTKTDVNKSYKMPRTCPCCSTPLEKPPGMVHLYCPNPECDDQVFARLAYAVGKDALDIDGCGETTVRQLMDQAKVRTLLDLFKITDFSFLKPATARKLKEGLEAAKKAPLWRKLSALSIEGIGKVSCQDMATKYCTVPDMWNDQAGLAGVIGEADTATFVNFINTNLDMLEALNKLGFYFEEDRKGAGVLSGKTFCITGSLLSGKRDDVSALIEQHGGVVKGTVTKKVDFLIQGVGGGNNKAAGASKHGTRIISEEELYQMIGIPMPLMQKNFEE